VIADDVRSSSPERTKTTLFDQLAFPLCM
jgi:hypothetical protein